MHMQVFHVLGLFGLFKKSKSETSGPEGAAGAVPGGPTVKVEMPPGSLPAPAPSQPEPPMDPLRRDLRFKGLHADVNPSQSVRPNQMTCTNCGRNFRYFTNSNGVATNVRCPGCTKQYRV